MAETCAMAGGCVAGQLMVTAPLTACPWCLTHYTTQVRSLPRAYLDLGFEMALHPERNDQPSGGHVKPKSRAPVDTAVDELRERIAWSVRQWAEVLSVQLGIGQHPYEHTRRAWQVWHASDVIAQHIPRMVGTAGVVARFDGRDRPSRSMSGVAGLMSLAAMHREARVRLRVVEVIIGLPGDCASCGTQAIQRIAGDEHVYCHACGGRWAYADYRRYVALQVGGAAALNDLLGQ